MVLLVTLSVSTALFAGPVLSSLVLHDLTWTLIVVQKNNVRAFRLEDSHPACDPSF